MQKLTIRVYLLIVSFLYNFGFSLILLKQNYCSCVYDVKTMFTPKELNFFDTNLAV